MGKGIKILLTEQEITDDLKRFLILYGERHPGTVALSNMLGLEVWQLVEHYAEHLENKEAEELYKNWGAEQAERAGWSFAKWATEILKDSPLKTILYP